MLTLLGIIEVDKCLDIKVLKQSLYFLFVTIV